MDEAQRFDWLEKVLDGKQYLTGDKFTAADALKINEARLGFGDFAECIRAIGHAANVRGVVRRADNAQLIARPWAHIHAIAVGDEVGGDVAGVHGEQIHFAFTHDLVQVGTRSGGDRPGRA